MITRLLGRSRADEQVAANLYASIVAQARQPALYSDFEVPDTVDGRFEMVVFHLVLLFHRLQAEDTPGQAIAQRVFDVFAIDMDTSLREMGVGDLGVPKRMKDVGRSFYGRLETYGKAIAESDRDSLTDALQRNLAPEGLAASPDCTALANYAISSAGHLRSAAFDDLAAGRLSFPRVSKHEQQETV